MSYHTVTTAVEAPGLDPLQRFWLSIRHVGQGQVSYSRYQRAGLSRAAEGTAPSEIEKLLLDWLQTDLNPTVQIARTSNMPSALVEGYNAFNRRVCVHVRTTMERSGSSITLVREMRGSSFDPEICKHATSFAMSTMVRQVAAREGRPLGDALSADHVARLLGVERSASAELSNLYETRGPRTVEQAASELGCSSRALQRALKDEGGSAEQIKIATRLLRAFKLMAGKLSLTQIALEAGYADSAHMSRSFMASCGLTPSEVRRASYSDSRAILKSKTMLATCST